MTARATTSRAATTARQIPATTNRRVATSAKRAQPAATQTLRGPQRERHDPDYLLLFSIVALAAMGILMVYSSTGVNSLLVDDPIGDVGSQVLWGVLGVIAMLVLMRIDYRYLRAVSVPAFLVAVALLVLVLLPAIGPIEPQVINDSARWLKIGPLPAMHPAEFAKLALVVYLAHWLARRGLQVRSFTNGMLPFLFIVLPILALVMLEPDLGTTGVLAMIALTMLFVAGGSLLQMAALAPVGIAALVFVVNLQPYQLSRVETFLNPWLVASGDGYQTVQGLLAMGSGGLFGIGLGQGSQPGSLVLPQAQNDFVFAHVSQELGFIGGIAVICLFLLFAYRGIRVALGAPDTFGALLAVGITGWLVLQAFINIAVVVVLVPTTGITLPFVSDGGSSLLVSFAAIGILLSVSRETSPRGTWNDADPDRRRWYRRPHLPRSGGRPVSSRAGA